MTGASEASAHNVTGVWDGLYSYGDEHFVAVLIDHGTHFSGTIHETPKLMRVGQLHANVSGEKAGAGVSFRKTYDGSGGWNHSVAYEGQFNSDGSEISGRWSIEWLSGSFLMIRAKQAPEVVTARRTAKALP